MEISKNDSTALIQAVEKGILGAEDLEQARNYIAINLAGSLLNSLKVLEECAQGVQVSYQKAIAIFDQKFQTDADSLELEDLMKYIEFFHKIMINTAEVKRKVAQGKELLGSYPTLTEEEKNIVQMLKSFNSPNEKKIFLDTLKSALKTQQISSDFEKDEKEGDLPQ